MRARVLLFPLALLAACSASTGPQPASDDTLALFDRLMRARCEHAVRCSPSYDDYWTTWPPPAACVDRVRLRDLVARGERVVDRDAALACLDALDASPPCRGAWAAGPPSRFVFAPGQRDPGALACDGSIVDPGFRHCGDETCAPFDGCTHDADCVAHCAHRPGLGETCDVREAPCREHLACDSSTNTCIALCDPWECVRTGAGTTCDRNRCVTPLDDGVACDPDSPLCRDGATCRSDTLRCAPLRAIGDACDPARDACVTRLPCDPTSLRCERPTVRPSACFAWEECPAGDTCIWGELAGDCETAPRDFIEGCAIRNDGFTLRDDCPPGTECSDGWSSLQSALCRPRALVGAACGMDVICEQGTRCTDGTCRRTVLPWETCDATSPCTPGYVCSDGACTTPFGHIGDPCEHGGDCAQGDCIAEHCAYRMPSESCPRGSECPDCSAGVCGENLPARRGEPCVGAPQCATWLWCQPPTPIGIDVAGYCCE